MGSIQNNPFMNPNLEENPENANQRCIVNMMEDEDLQEIERENQQIRKINSVFDTVNIFLIKL